MKNLLLLLVFGLFFTTAMNAQDMTLAELQTKKADLETKLAAAQADVDTYAGDIAGLQDQINKLSGWITGFGGNIGFNLNDSNNWIANPNPNATSSGLNIGLTAFANQDKDKSLWYNKALLTKAWQDIDLSAADGTVEEDNLFDNGTVDILNLSSLYGYKITKSLALSALGEANTSLGNFFKPGTIDIGAGLTYTGIENLVLVVHPLNYHIAFPADGTGFDSQGALGAKFRADYGREFSINGRKLMWSSTLTGFFPYSDVLTDTVDSDGNAFQAGLSEYTWLNTLSFEVWKGIGVGISAGLRDADFEDVDLNQKFYSLGLTYVL